MNSSNNLPKNENQIEVAPKDAKDENQIEAAPEVIVIGDDDETKSFEYVKDDKEEEAVMQRMGDKNDDFDLLTSLINGEYFSNKPFLNKKRRQYGVVREKEVDIKDEYKLKYLKKLEQIDDKERNLDSKNKNYKLEYYNLLEINEKKNELISDLEKQLSELKDLLIKSKSENYELRDKNDELKGEDNRLKEENNALAVRTANLEFDNMQSEIEKNRIRNEKKELFKKSMIKCPICFFCHPKSNIILLSCRHYICGYCFDSLTDTKCPTCGAEFWTVDLPHYYDDANSADFNDYENYYNNL